MPAAILDVDGTLVDSNYLHAVSWQRAFRAHGYEVPAWVIHRRIGMGGDKLVAAAAGERAERRHGDAIRELEGRLFSDMIDQVRPLPGARDLVEGLAAHDLEVVLASSAGREQVEHYLGLLDVAGAVSAWTSSADVDQTKPEPDLVQVALQRVGDPRDAVMIGDSVWDGQAAARAGVPFLAVRSGGISDQELSGAGAQAVLRDAAELCERLDVVLGALAPVAT
jgi:phosphoglycolate phosphatase-like HAD superfamily hydrolase